MYYKNGDANNNDNWEHVSFFLPAWEESDWIVRWKKGSGFADRFCANELDDNNLIDDVWKIKSQYWDIKHKRLLIDVSRPLYFAEDNEWGAATLDYDANLNVVISYGVWNDMNDRDDNGNKWKGDKNKDAAQQIMILNNAVNLVVATAVTAATMVYLF